MAGKRDEMKCWLCERGTNLNNGGLQPGELVRDFFGDMICIYCRDRIEFTAELLSNPNLIPLMAGIDRLPKVDGVKVGIEIERGDE